MSDLEPIELEFITNSPEFLSEINSMSKGMRDFDVSVENAQKNFDEQTKSITRGSNASRNFGNIIGNTGQQILQGKGKLDALSNSLEDFIVDTVQSTNKTKFLTTVKNLWSAANLRVATTLGISTAAAQVLTATLTLGLGVALVAIIALVKNWQTESAAAAEQQKKMREAIADNAAESIVSFRSLQAQWNALSEDLKAKEQFIHDNKDAFNKLGIQVDNVSDAENVLVKNSNNVVNALLARAKAAALYEMAVESYKEYLKVQNEVSERREKRSKETGFVRGANTAQDWILENTGAQNDQDDANKLWQKTEKLIRQEMAAKQEEDSFFTASNAKRFNDDKKHAEKTAKLKSDARTKEKSATQNHQNELKKLYDDIRKEELKLLNSQSSESSEIAKIETHFDTLIAKAKELKAGAEAITKLELLKSANISDAQYKDETKTLLENLDQQKEMYAAFEAYKTRIGEDEAAKRLGINLNEFSNYGDVLDAEITSLKEKQNLTKLEQERLEELQNRKAEFSKTSSAEEIEKYAVALEATTTYEESKAQIEKQFSDQKLLLEKNLSGELLEEKLRLLEEQKNASIDALNAEAFAKTEIFRELNENLIGITKRDLENRLRSLEEFLSIATGITEQQKNNIRAEINRLKAVQGKSDNEVKINALLQQRKNIQDALNSSTGKSAEDILKLKEELIKVNSLLGQATLSKIARFADWAAMIQASFSDLANAIGDSNEGLSDTLSTISEIAGVANNAANALLSFGTGDIVGGIGSIISAIGGLFSIGKKARESERKAQEEIRKWQAEQFQSALDYNVELRKRISDEIKLNDLYKSRVDNIREEMEANKKNKEQIIKDQKAVFDRLLKASTVIGMTTEKYGGFLGIGKKTKAVEQTQTVAQLLGIGSASTTGLNGVLNNLGITVWDPGQVQLTDEIFDKLEKLNAEKPLTGDAKAAFEQLKKLRDEYGSMEEAQRQLAIELKNAITGTTAQAIGDSIRQGILSGKKSFADFAEDIEKFLRDGIIAGMSAKVIEPEMQKLQDALAEFLDDGVLTEEEKKKFQEMYVAIAEQASEYLDLINQSGINVVNTTSGANSLAGAYKSASQESIDLLAGQTGGMRVAQLETNQLLKAGAAQQLQANSKMIALQIDIEKNTRKTAENTTEIDTTTKSIDKTLKTQYNDLKAVGII